MNKNVIKDGFPFEIGSEGCFVVIKSGLAGEFKIRQEFIAVDVCQDGSSVLCDGSDESEFVGVIDISKMRTGFSPVIVGLLPSDFGFGTKEELIQDLSNAAGREVRLNCCLVKPELEVADEEVFCKTKPGSAKVCSFVPGDTSEGIVVMKTNAGNLILPNGTNEEVVEAINAWIQKNGLKGTAEVNPTDVAADWIIRDAEFVVYSVESIRKTEFLNSCEVTLPTK